MKLNLSPYLVEEKVLELGGEKTPCEQGCKSMNPALWRRSGSPLPVSSCDQGLAGRC